MVLNVFNTLRNVFVPSKCHRKLFLRFCYTPPSRVINQFAILKEKLLSNTSGYSPEFVNTVKHEVFKAGNRITPDNFDSLFMEACIQNNFFEVAKSFFLQHYQRNNNLSLALTRKYFRLCFNFKDACTDTDKEFLITLYMKIIEHYNILDAISCESLSMGLSITDKWLDCLKLLNMCKAYSKPTNQLYSSIIKAAFQNNNKSLGWDLMNEMMESLTDCKPHPSVYSTILQGFSDSSIIDLFKFLENYGLNIPEETAVLIKENKGGKITNITVSGICQSCFKYLAPIVISDSEFKELTEDFLNPVLVGKDIFIKSKPSELEKFHNFLVKSNKVDIVLDGLNIAFAGTKKKSSANAQSKMLVDVVKHFTRKGLNVMVLGREHMRRWTPADMNFIVNNTATFFAEDLSLDDPFLLYATMHSGLGTKFVSRDLMRGHKYLLKTPETKRTFYKWQQKHQLLLSYIEKNGTVHLKKYCRYLINTQCKGDSWHVPIQEPNQPGLQPHIQALNSKWLCINLACNPV